MDFTGISKITRSAIRELPGSWKKINKSYLQTLSRKENLQLNFLAILVGIGIGYGALGFRTLIGFMQNYLMHDKFGIELMSPIHHVRGYWIFLILPLGLLISTIITRYLASEAKGHGVPEVIEAVWRKSGRIRKRIVAVKALASSVTIAAGGSVGREGPIVQIGSALGSALAQLLDLRPKVIKTLVGCGAAGAIAATFNTPIAGVIFAIEVIVLELKTKSFVPLVISSVFATVVSRMYIGNEPAFYVPEYTLKSPHELIFYLLLGVVSGVVGVAIIKTLYSIEDFFDNLKVPFWMKPLGAGLVLAGLGTFVPEIYGVGYGTISDVLQANSSFLLMFSLVFLKPIAMSITLGGGGSGGVFAPSLFIGAMVGGSFGYVVHLYFPDFTATYGAYALVGMAALFSATARATFTAIVILFEMTLDYSIILPLMFVCVTADQVAWALSKESIYSLKLKRKGLNFVTDLSANVMSMTHVKSIMTTELATIRPEMDMKYVLENILPRNHTTYPVINEKSELLGLITKDRLLQISKDGEFAKVLEVMVPTKAIVDPEDSVSVALTKIEKSRDPRIMVVDRATNQLVGIVSPVDFVRLNFKEMH